MSRPTYIAIDAVWGVSYAASPSFIVDGAALDLNDFDAYWTFKDSVGRPDSGAILQHSTVAETISVDGDDSKILNLSLEEADAKKMPPDRAVYWDLKIVDKNTSQTFVYYHGHYIGRRGVTQSS